MGGRGSGRHWHSGAKDTTSDFRALDVRRLQRDGLLAAGQAFGWNWLRNDETVASIQVRTEADRIILSYRHRTGGGEWQSEEYPVWLDWTPCTYGGRRAWFICPARGCGKREAGGDSLRRWHLRLSALLSAGLPQPAGISPRPGGATGGQDQGAAWLGTGNSEWFGRKAERDAPANFPAATVRARWLCRFGARRHGAPAGHHRFEVIHRRLRTNLFRKIGLPKACLLWRSTRQLASDKFVIPIVIPIVIPKIKIRSGGTGFLF